MKKIIFLQVVQNRVCTSPKRKIFVLVQWYKKPLIKGVLYQYVCTTKKSNKTTKLKYYETSRANRNLQN